MCHALIKKYQLTRGFSLLGLCKVGMLSFLGWKARLMRSWLFSRFFLKLKKYIFKSMY
jgi:hypothetical protein